VDLDLPRELVEERVGEGSGAGLYVDRLLAAAWWKERPIDAHKYSVGTVLCVGGSAGMSGAIALAANASHRAGAGLVEAIVPGGIRNSVDAHCLETLVHGVPETAAGGLAPTALEKIRLRLEGKGSLILGPGGGNDLESAELFLALVGEATCPVVVDADGLNAFVRLQRRPEFVSPAVLTPHSGELARLLGVDSEEIDADRVATLCEASARWNCVLLHKGAPSMVAGPDGSVAVIGSGGAGLATAGSGDVLSGVIGGLLATGYEPFEAAALGAYLHGRAGDRLERRSGVASLMARDLLEELGPTIFEIESWRR
jgi:NAD(P)H-hydrate epimerase